jgi:hypothetical protein
MPTFGRRPPEKRRAPREKGRAPATIEVGNVSPRKCFVLELSETGAFLEVESILGIPDQFHLRMAGKGSRLVEVVRRHPGRVAVKFC